MKPLQKRYQFIQHFQKAIDEGKFPLGMIAYYGPDNTNVTKIMVAVMLDEEASLIIKKWMGKGIAEKPQAITDIGRFLNQYQVNKVVMTDGIIGCPHKEGIDFPLGEKCSECLYWVENQHQ